MQQPGGAPYSFVGKSAIERRRVQFLAGRKLVSKIEWINAAGDTHLMCLIFFYGDLPGATPSQRTEPYIAMIFIRLVASLDGEPRILLVSRRSTTAFKNNLSRMHSLLLEIPFAGPSASEVTKLIVRRLGKIPGCRPRLLNGERRFRSFSMTAERPSIPVLDPPDSPAPHRLSVRCP